MESLKNEPVYFGTQGQGVGQPIINVPGGYGHSHGDLLSTILLASVLGGRGFGNYGGKDKCCDSDTIQAVNEAVQRLQNENSHRFSHLQEQISDTEKEAIKSGYEARLESQKAKSDIIANQNANTISIKDDVKDFRFDTNSKFCELGHSIDKSFCGLSNELDKKIHHLEHVVSKGFAEQVEREYKEEIRSLRNQVDKFQHKETSKDLAELQRDVNRILCGLSKVAPTVTTKDVLTGCC